MTREALASAPGRAKIWKTRSRRGRRSRFGTLRDSFADKPRAPPPPPRPSRRAPPPGVPPTRAMASPVALGAPSSLPGRVRAAPSLRPRGRAVVPAAIVRLRSRPSLAPPRRRRVRRRPDRERGRDVRRHGVLPPLPGAHGPEAHLQHLPRGRASLRGGGAVAPRVLQRALPRGRTTRRRRSTARRTATSTCPSSAAPAELWSEFEDLHECLDIGHANQVHHPLPCREIAADPGPESAVSSAPHGGVRFAEPDAVILVAIPSEKETAEETPDADWLEWSGANRARSCATYLGAALHEAVETREGGAPAFRRIARVELGAAPEER